MGEINFKILADRTVFFLCPSATRTIPALQTWKKQIGSRSLTTRRWNGITFNAWPFSQNLLIQWARTQGKAPGGPRATNLLGVINKTVQIPMVGLNIESIVSFPHNTFQTGEGVIEAVIPVTVSWIHCFHKNHNVSEKACISHTAGCTDSLSHSFNKRATISGRAKGAGDMPPAPILQTIFAMCSFKLKMYQNLFSAGAPSQTPLGELMTLSQIP